MNRLGPPLVSSLGPPFEARGEPGAESYVGRLQPPMLPRELDLDSPDSPSRSDFETPDAVFGHASRNPRRPILTGSSTGKVHRPAWP